MARLLDAVEGGAQGALSVRELLGQRLYRDVRAVGEPVQVGGDGGFAGWEVGEVVVRARGLAGGRAFAVARPGHGVRGRDGGTKVGVSHVIACSDLDG